MGKSFYQREEETDDAIRVIIHWIVDVLAVIILGVFFVQYMGTTHKVLGHSMEPAYEAGDVVLVNRISYNVHKPERFDVILFTNHEKEDQLYMKRVVGLPGETIQIQSGNIYIDDVLLDLGDNTEKINLAGIADNPITLAKDEYFVIGDNYDSSEDSRFSNIGNVNQSEIVGKVWFRLQPFERIGFAR